MKQFGMAAIAVSLSTSFFSGQSFRNNELDAGKEDSSGKISAVVKNPDLSIEQYKNLTIDGPIKLSLDIPSTALPGALNSGGKVSERRSGSAFTYGDLKVEIIQIKTPRADELPGAVLAKHSDQFSKSPTAYDSFRVERFPQCPKGFEGCEIEFKRNGTGISWQRQLVFTQIKTDQTSTQDPVVIVVHAWAHHPAVKDKPLSDDERAKLYEQWNSSFAALQRSFSSLKVD